MHIDKYTRVGYHGNIMMSEINLFNKRWLGRGRMLALVGLLIVLLIASACQPSIQLLAPGEPAATVVPSARALAIVGVDFDPPLDNLQTIAGSGLRLLVAIENRGQHREFDLEVTARLFDPADRTETSSLLDETVVIDALAPGELRLVSFSQVTKLPIRGRYSLVVELSAVPGELELWDNSHTYEIIVNGAQ